MIMLGSSLCNNEIIPAVFMVHMRCLRRCRISESTVPDSFRFSGKLHFLQIKFCDPDSPVHTSVCPLNHISGSQNICTPVVINKERCVNSRDIIQPMRFGPWTGRIFCRNNIVSFITEICINNIKNFIII